MKKRTFRLIITLLFILSVAISCAGKMMEKPVKGEGLTNFFPQDEDIKGWKRSGEMLKAANGEELYKIINGGAVLYINHGFRSYAGQIYKGPQGLELEMAIYDLGSARNARELYRDPLVKPNRSQVLENLGEEARLDEGSLFHLVVEFIQDRFFVRVIIQDKSASGPHIAKLFALYATKQKRVNP